MTDIKIKNYKIGKRIGKGSFSTVYKAFNSDNNIVAIKQICLEDSKNKSAFLKEFNLMRKLNHINIINVFDIVLEDKNTVYLVLEYFKKGDLSRFIKGKQLEEKFVQKYTLDLKNGLEYLLTQNIVHRDLKPQNILVSDSNILKICDFGFARHFTNNMMFATICGSPLYMAPEIINKKQYSNKSDLWSLGIIIYEMIYGEVPYKASNFIDLVNKINKYTIFFPKSTEISDNCLDLIKKLLTKDAYKRIEWNDFLNHKWFDKNLTLEHENSLIENPLFNYNSNKIRNEVKSFKYKSICEDMVIDNSFEFNFNLKQSPTSESYYSVDSFNSLNSLEDNSDNEEDEEDSKELYLNYLENKTHIKLKSTPIEISSNTKESYIFVDSVYKNKKFNHKSKSLSDSIKEYFSNSLNFMKQGYEYISKSSSL
jgi:serine/threonine protein kinase